MKKILKGTGIVIVCAVAITILWTQANKKESVLADTTIKETTANVTFPKNYKKEVSENFCIDAEVVCAENFDANQVYCAQAHIVEPDKEKWKEEFLEEANAYEHIEFEGSTREGNALSEEGFLCEGENNLFLSAQTANVYDDDCEYIDNCLNWEGQEYEEIYNLDKFPTDQSLSFADTEKVWKDTEILLERLNIPMEQAVLEHRYSLPYQVLQEEEQKAFGRGELEKDELKERWSQEDEGYYLYIWQYCQGMPVLPTTYADDFDVKTLDGGLTLLMTADGLKKLNMNYWMEFEETDEKLQLLPLEDVLQTIIDKYAGVVGDNFLTLNYCRLFETPIYQGDNTYEMLPVWICQIDDGVNTSDTYIPVNAVTGEIVEEIMLE